MQKFLNITHGRVENGQREKKGNFKTDFKTGLRALEQKICVCEVLSEISAVEKNQVSVRKYILDLKLVSLSKIRNFSGFSLG